MKGKLYGVGVGPGDPQLMTLKAVSVIAQCDVIATPKASGDERVAFNIAKEVVPQLMKKPLLLLDMPMTRDKNLLTLSHQKAAEEIIVHLEHGKNVSFLTLGDPSIYSTYMYIHERVLSMGYEVEMIPGVPSFCAVAARLNISLTKASQGLHVIPASYQGLDEELDLKGTKILMKSGKSIGVVKEKLKEKGLEQQAMMVQKCGMEDEVVYYNMEDVEEGSSYFSTIIVRATEE